MMERLIPFVDLLGCLDPHPDHRRRRRHRCTTSSIGRCSADAPPPRRARTTPAADGHGHRAGPQRGADGRPLPQLAQGAGLPARQARGHRRRRRDHRRRRRTDVVNGTDVNGNGRRQRQERQRRARRNGKFIPVGDFDGVVRLVARSKAGQGARAQHGHQRVAHGEHRHQHRLRRRARPAHAARAPPRRSWATPHWPRRRATSRSTGTSSRSATTTATSCSTRRGSRSPRAVRPFERLLARCAVPRVPARVLARPGGAGHHRHHVHARGRVLGVPARGRCSSRSATARDRLGGHRPHARPAPPTTGASASSGRPSSSSSRCWSGTTCTRSACGGTAERSSAARRIARWSATASYGALGTFAPAQDAAHRPLAGVPAPRVDVPAPAARHLRVLVGDRARLARRDVRVLRGPRDRRGCSRSRGSPGTGDTRRAVARVLAARPRAAGVPLRAVLRAHVGLPARARRAAGVDRHGAGRERAGRTGRGHGRAARPRAAGSPAAGCRRASVPRPAGASRPPPTFPRSRAAPRCARAAAAHRSARSSCPRVSREGSGDDGGTHHDRDPAALARPSPVMAARPPAACSPRCSRAPSCGSCCRPCVRACSPPARTRAPTCSRRSSSSTRCKATGHVPAINPAWYAGFAVLHNTPLVVYAILVADLRAHRQPRHDQPHRAPAPRAARRCRLLLRAADAAVRPGRARRRLHVRDGAGRSGPDRPRRVVHPHAGADARRAVLRLRRGGGGQRASAARHRPAGRARSARLAVPPADGRGIRPRLDDLPGPAAGLRTQTQLPRCGFVGRGHAWRQRGSPRGT